VIVSVFINPPAQSFGYDNTASTRAVQVVHAGKDALRDRAGQLLQDVGEIVGVEFVGRGNQGGRIIDSRNCAHVVAEVLQHLRLRIVVLRGPRQPGEPWAASIRADWRFPVAASSAIDNAAHPACPRRYRRI
jgi:hypothetical protein